MDELQRRILGGDRQALTDLYLQNKGILYHIAQRYATALARDRAIDLDDLLQSGYMGLVEAMHAWDPERGKWVTIAALHIKSAMRKTLGISSARIRAEHGAWSLDEPLGEDGDATFIDTLKDIDAPDIDAQILREEIGRNVRAAVRDLKDEPVRQIVQLCDLDGQTLHRAGELLGLTVSRTVQLRNKGRAALHRDARIRALGKAYDLDDHTRFYAHKGVTAFHRDMTSTTEAVALWRIDHRR